MSSVLVLLKQSFGQSDPLMEVFPRLFLAISSQFLFDSFPELVPCQWFWYLHSWFWADVWSWFSSILTYSIKWSYACLTALPVLTAFPDQSQKSDHHRTESTTSREARPPLMQCKTITWNNWLLLQNWCTTQKMQLQLSRQSQTLKWKHDAEYQSWFFEVSSSDSASEFAIFYKRWMHHQIQFL